MRPFFRRIVTRAALACLAVTALFLVVRAIQAHAADAVTPLDVPRLSGRVVDAANMLSPRAEQEIARISGELERTDSTQVVVLTVSSLKGEPLEDYALRVAEAWGLGHKGKDNGVLILAAQAERRMRIEVGYGLEGRLTDLVAGRILDNVMTPYFKAGDFDSGFVAGAQAVSQAVRGEFKGTGGAGSTGGKGGAHFSSMGLLLILALTFPLGLIGRFARPTGRTWRNRSHMGGFWIGGGGGFGGGGFGGGGFGGGGGGFGGGGASGGW